MEAVTIRRDQVKDYCAVLADRGRYRSVVAHWQNLEKGKQATERAGEGEPVFTLRQNYPTAAQARSAAQSRLDLLSRGRSTVSVFLANGDPKLRAQSRVNLTGFRSGVDGKWVATRVIHLFAARAYSNPLGSRNHTRLVCPCRV